jgi:putative alpha-1,2-mannosidase
VDSATIRLNNGKIFVITAHNQSEKNIYVHKIMLDGKPLNDFFITHEQIINGGRLEYFMGDKVKG